MQFTFEQVATLIGMLAALGVSCWRIIEYVNRERDKLDTKIEAVRTKIHDLANRVHSKMEGFATKDDLERVERLLLAARGYDPKSGDE